ncbi:GNAT family N-acetyltransferase [Clostridium oryzae]|uniref:Putative ribosomal N-acetyltransferase YdaF n=1 Tax=Clostridium oryzae TaxID=1450648 RepID=A0A1V4ITQ7_9CLOT|nr:GNAT family N-acetyltransferase [Clostridium oryzae]OPJ62847.1 putative ribosomal N-acetyltransferase YdaF [Clostridium oryzae]
MRNIGTRKIETKRLILRKFKEVDKFDMYNNWASDPEVTKMLTWPTHAAIEVTEIVIKRWINNYSENNYYHWAIQSKEPQSVIGSISLNNVDYSNDSCEIGYCIGKRFWNKGIATEALRAVLSFAFKQMKVNRITGRHHIDNAASGRVMEKCGFRYEGTLRQIIKDGRGNLVDCKYYSILKNEFIDI